nr:hypothetical protein [Tanacetum cinerariifolium]
MENTLEISECAEGNKVKFSTATLHGRTLTWWNSQVATLGHEVANRRPWAEVKQMMTDEFCPIEEVHRKFEQRMKESLKASKGSGKTIIKATTTTTTEANQTGIVPKCNRCGRCQFDQCPSKCENCGRLGHKAKDCQSKNVALGAAIQLNVVCYKCAERSHKSYERPKKAERKSGNVQGQAYVICDAKHNQGPNVVMAGFENRPPMVNKENYVPWLSRLFRYAKSRPNGKLIHNSIINGPYIKADDQAIQAILLGLLEDINAAVDSCETAQEIWFTSTDEESIESYYHHFLKLMNDLKRNKHFPEKIASNLKFLNNLQPEWSRHVTIVHQTKDLHTADYTQLYDFLKYNQKENVGNLNGYNDIQNVRNQNPNGNGNLVAARAEADLDEIEKVNANCILMANLQQTSTSGTQTNKALVHDSDGSTEVHNYEDCYDNEIFNMFTQEEQYTELLEPIHEPHQVTKNDNNVIFMVFSVEQSEETVEQHPANVEETRVLYDSLYNNLAIEVVKVNTVNRKLKETNTKFTTELARFKIKKSVLKLVKKNMTNLKDVIRRVDNTKTRRPQPRSNTKNDMVPSTSKSSRNKNKEVDVEEHHRKLLLSRNKKHMSSKCNNIKLATQNVRSKVVCVMCNVSINEHQNKQQPKVKKTKKGGSIERLASPKPSTPRSFLSSGLDLTYAPLTITTQQPTEGELDLLFEAMYDDYIGGQPLTASQTVLAAHAHQVRQAPTTSTSIADTAPTPTNSSSQATNFPNTSQDVDELNSQQQHAQQQGNQA